MSELESIVRELEASRMPLGDLVDNYERGTMLLDYCRGEIQIARQRVEKITLSVGGGASGPGELSESDKDGGESGPTARTPLKSVRKRAAKTTPGNEDDDDVRLL